MEHLIGVLVACSIWFVAGLLYGWQAMWWWQRKELRLGMRLSLLMLIPRERLPFRNTTYSVHEALGRSTYHYTGQEWRRG